MTSRAVAIRRMWMSPSLSGRGRGEHVARQRAGRRVSARIGRDGAARLRIEMRNSAALRTEMRSAGRAIPLCGGGMSTRRASARFVHGRGAMTGPPMRLAVAALLLPMSLGACGQEHPGAEGALPTRLPPGDHATVDEPFEPIPQSVSLDPRRVELGRRLFEDPRLSGSGERACVDCHDLGAGGIVPGEPKSNHPRNETGPYNVPTVFNVAYNFRFNWNGKFETLEGHLSGPMMSENVMDAGSWDALVERIRGHYRDDFVEAGYRDGVDEDNVRDALATYERALITPNSRFDRYLRGEIELDEDEERGFELFKTVGCITCHQGINVGGNLFQRFGVVADAFEGRPVNERDMGRYLLTGNEEDAHVFRVPSLRNVEVTAPYFHDGSAATLQEAVKHMARVQLGYMLSEREVRDLVAFLRTLTGTLHGVSLAKEGGR